MTHNQIEYANVAEQQRHHRQDELTNINTLAESKRHNVQTERLGYGTLAESTRHNKQSEAIGFGNIGLGYASLAESQRHNIAVEGYQREQAHAYAGKATAETGYTYKQLDNYERVLRQKDRELGIMARNARTQAERNKIEQQRTEIQEALADAQTNELNSQSFRNYIETITEGARDISQTVRNVDSILQSRRRDNVMDQYSLFG